MDTRTEFPQNRPNSPYTTLGLRDYSPYEAVKKAYRRLALQTHPDKNRKDPTAAERFRVISTAYGMLSPEETKAETDKQLRARAPFSSLFLARFDAYCLAYNQDPACISTIPAILIPLINSAPAELHTFDFINNVFTLSTDELRHRLAPRTLRVWDSIPRYFWDDLFNHNTHSFEENEALLDYFLTQEFLAAYRDGHIQLSWFKEASKFMGIAQLKCITSPASIRFIHNLSSHSNYFAELFITALLRPNKGNPTFSSERFYSAQVLAYVLRPVFFEYLKQDWYQFDNKLMDFLAVVQKLTEHFKPGNESIELLLTPSILKRIKETEYILNFANLASLSPDGLKRLFEPKGHILFEHFDLTKKISKGVLDRMLMPGNLRAVQWTLDKFKVRQRTDFCNVLINHKHPEENPLVRYILNRDELNFEACLQRVKDELATVDFPAATQLLQTLSDAKQKFLTSNNPIEAQDVFVKTCRSAIEEAIPELESYVNLVQILYDILNALSLLLTLGISYAYSGRFRLFQAKHITHVAVDELDSAFDEPESTIDDSSDQTSWVTAPQHEQYTMSESSISEISSSC